MRYHGLCTWPCRVTIGHMLHTKLGEKTKENKMSTLRSSSGSYAWSVASWRTFMTSPTCLVLINSSSFICLAKTSQACRSGSNCLIFNLAIQTTPLKSPKFLPQWCIWQLTLRKMESCLTVVQKLCVTLKIAKATRHKVFAPSLNITSHTRIVV